MTHQPQNDTQNSTEVYLLSNLTHQIIGCLFDVFKELDFGYREPYYQRALVESFNDKKITFEREKYYRIEYKGKIIGRHFVDFVIDDKVALELKVGNDFYQQHINQLLSYLKHSSLEVGLLAVVTSDGIKIKRLINSA